MMQTVARTTLTSQRDVASSSVMVSAWWMALAVMRLSQGLTGMHDLKPLKLYEPVNSLRMSGRWRCS